MTATAPVFAHAGTDVASWARWILPVLAGGLPAATYLFGVRRIRDRYGRRWSRWRKASFVGGCGLLAVALTPIVEHAAAEGARGDMVQHLLVGMYAPLGLVLGAPVTLLLGASPVDGRRAVRTWLRRRPVRVATTLVAATALNAGGLLLLYLTPLYTLSTRSEVVHHLTHLHFLAAGYLFAWAVTGPDPSPTRSPVAWRVAAVIATAGTHNVVAKLLYSRAPELPPGAAVDVGEIEVAAQWMYYGGHLAEALVLLALFATWYRRAPRLRTPPHRSTFLVAGPKSWFGTKFLDPRQVLLARRRPATTDDG